MEELIQPLVEAARRCGLLGITDLPGLTDALAPYDDSQIAYAVATTTRMVRHGAIKKSPLGWLVKKARQTDPDFFPPATPQPDPQPAPSPSPPNEPQPNRPRGRDDRTAPRSRPRATRTTTRRPRQPHPPQHPQPENPKTALRQSPPSTPAASPPGANSTPHTPLTTPRPPGGLLMPATTPTLTKARSQNPGRLPPQDLDAEASLLGAALLSRAARDAAAETGLTADEFYKPAHGHIYDAICTLDGRGDPADPVTVADELKRAGLFDTIGGLTTLISLQAETPATTSAGRYARIVREMAQLRRLIATAGEIAELGYSLPENVPAAVDHAESMLFAVGQHVLTDTIRPLDEILAEGLDHIEALLRNGDTCTGLPTGFIDLDPQLSGLQPGDLIVLGSRPGVGKTALALDIARHVTTHQRRPVLLFSLEMSHLQLSQSLLAAEANIPLERIRSGGLTENDWTNLVAASQTLAGAPLLIDDNRDLTITEIRAKARRTRAHHGDLALVIVDYVQLMSSDANRPENRQLEVAQISRGCKILAGELGVPVLALSSISRGVEARADKRPILSDLRESGALEADADVVLLPYRDELYHPDSPDRGTAEINVAKQRNGPTGTIRLAFLGHHTRFANMARL